MQFNWNLKEMNLKKRENKVKTTLQQIVTENCLELM